MPKLLFFVPALTLTDSLCKQLRNISKNPKLSLYFQITENTIVTTPPQGDIHFFFCLFISYCPY